MYTTPNRATLSIWGLNLYDNHIFDNMVVPANVDADKVKENILIECAELELLYPDWDFMKDAISLWSNTELPTWTRIANLAALEYNPIENYDRRENALESESRQRDTTRNDDITNKSTGNSVNTSESLTRVAGFNSSALGVKDKTTDGNSSNSNNSGESKQITTEGGTDNTGRVHSSHIHGNIGVTTTQQMAEQELNIAPKLNVVKYIVESFKQRFCLLVY